MYICINGIIEGKSVSVSVSIGSESGVGIQSSLALDESTIEFVEYDVAEIENRHHRILVYHTLASIPCHHATHINCYCANEIGTRA